MSTSISVAEKHKSSIKCIDRLKSDPEFRQGIDRLLAGVLSDEMIDEPDTKQVLTSLLASHMAKTAMFHELLEHDSPTFRNCPAPLCKDGLRLAQQGYAVLAGELLKGV